MYKPLLRHLTLLLRTMDFLEGYCTSPYSSPSSDYSHPKVSISPWDSMTWRKLSIYLLPEPSMYNVFREIVQCCFLLRSFQVAVLYLHAQLQVSELPSRAVQKILLRF